MMFQEPKAEFIRLEMVNASTTSPGAGYNVCEKYGVSGMDQDAFCAAMNQAGMPLPD